MKFIAPRLLPLVSTSRLSLGVSIIAGCIGGMLVVTQAWLFSRVVTGVFLGGADLAGSSVLLGALLVVYLGRAAALWVGDVAAKRLAFKVKTTLRAKLYAHIQELGPLYTRGERTGELINTATEGIEALDAYFSEYLPQLALAALLPLTYLFFVFPLDWLSGLVLLLTAPLIPVFMVLIGDRADSMTRRQWHTLSRMSAHFLDVLQGLTTLKLLGRSRAQIDGIRFASEQFQARTMGVLRVAFLSALVLELVATLSTAVIAVEIGLRLLYGRLAFEQALFVLLLAPEFYIPLRLLGTRFHAGIAGAAAADRIFKILDVRPDDRIMEADQAAGYEHPAHAVPSPDHAVIFDSVSYTYPDGRTALHNVSFTIEPGQKVALVGPSGSGKSTIASLLLGWAKPGDGWMRMAVEAGGIAWLPQTPYLFNDTIAANIRIARPGASIEQVISAARAAQLHEFADGLAGGRLLDGITPDRKDEIRSYRRLSGLDASEDHQVIGERGARLSTGQAQRVALARAFLMDSPFVILDEPAANLDPGLETRITQSLERLLEDRTALIIAHRLNTIRNADKIIVLDAGQVVQQGTYDELIAQTGLFRSMVARVENHKPPTGQEPPRSALTSQQPPKDPIPLLQNHGPEPLDTPRKTLFRLLAFLRPNLGWTVLSTALGFLTIASSIGLMGTSAYIISAAALQPSIAALQLPIVGVRFFGVSRGLFRYLERLSTHQTTFRILAQLRVWFYARLEPLAPARLQQVHSGDLLTKIVGNINTLESFYIRVVAPPLTALLVAVFAGILLMRHDPQLAFVLWVFMLLAGVLLPAWIYKLASDLGSRTLQSRAALNIALVDGLQGLPDLQAFGRGPDQLQRIRELGDQLARIQLRFARLTAMGTAFLNLLNNLGTWMVLVLAIPLVASGEIEGLFLAAIALIASASFEAVQPLPAAAVHLDENLRAAERLFEIVDAEPEVSAPQEPQPTPGDHTLAVRDLVFRYKTSHKNHPSPFKLRLSSFSLPQGSRVAIVGPSGSGKTTLLDLLLRFWDFHEGEITLGGQDIRSFDPEDLRRKFAVVSQHTHLFNTSFRENLLVARPGAAQAEIVRSAQAAKIHEFIEALPEGYDTIVGEQGLQLSGGERQRVAIARALLKDAPILVLDEPTANLDPRTELEVLKSIHDLMRGRSTLMVTHRLVGMDWMDDILVLRDGEIVESGCHSELLAQDGLYRQMWDLQNQGLG